MIRSARSRIRLAAAVPLLLAVPLLAAPPAPAHWSVQHLPAKAVAPGAVFTVQVAAAIDPGWHLYALEEPEGGPLPTEIGLQEGDPLTLLDVSEPNPAKIPDPVTHAMAGLFVNDVAFTLKLRAPRTRPAAGTSSHVLVRYQTCNDQVCLPPRTEAVALPLNGVLR